MGRWRRRRRGRGRRRGRRRRRRRRRRGRRRRRRRRKRRGEEKSKTDETYDRFLARRTLYTWRLQMEYDAVARSSNQLEQQVVVSNPDHS